LGTGALLKVAVTIAIFGGRCYPVEVAVITAVFIGRWYPVEVAVITAVLLSTDALSNSGDNCCLFWSRVPI